jgi:hypothetical protein
LAPPQGVAVPARVASVALHFPDERTPESGKH